VEEQELLATSKRILEKNTEGLSHTQANAKAYEILGQINMAIGNYIATWIEGEN
jgi:hypothetical protein